MSCDELWAWAVSVISSSLVASSPSLVLVKARNGVPDFAEDNAPTAVAELVAFDGSAGWEASGAGVLAGDADDWAAFALGQLTLLWFSENTYLVGIANKNPTQLKLPPIMAAFLHPGRIIRNQLYGAKDSHRQKQEASESQSTTACTGRPRG